VAATDVAGVVVEGGAVIADVAEEDRELARVALDRQALALEGVVVEIGDTSLADGATRQPVGDGAGGADHVWHVRVGPDTRATSG
jgi:hypothetical protein